MKELPQPPISIDVSEVLGEVLGDVRKSVTSLYSSLVTRPTGRAVRAAIEMQLVGAGSVSLSLIDFSEVAIIDFSCADEVVAKLLQQYRVNGPPDAFFVFRGIHEPHRDQIETVLRRQGLAAVVESHPGLFSVAGESSDAEARVWSVLEERGSIAEDDIERLLPDPTDRDALASLVVRGLAFRGHRSGRVTALSRLVHHIL
jgi:hypothetical protein